MGAQRNMVEEGKTLLSYYHIVEDRYLDEENEDFALPIVWNIDNIASQSIANGAIVQHMNIQSNVEIVPSNNYYEAWCVRNGRISVEDRNEFWDDLWSVPYTMIDEDISNVSVTFSADVYWIPKSTIEYESVMGWKRNTCPEAGDLRATQTINWDIQPFFVCSRCYVSNRK